MIWKVLQKFRMKLRFKEVTKFYKNNIVGRKQIYESKINHFTLCLFQCIYTFIWFNRI